MRTGIVTVKDFKEPTLKAWNALTNLVKENNRLGYVQGVGFAPARVKEDGEAYYGDGAFLLAGKEVYQFLEDYVTTIFSSTPSENSWLHNNQPTFHLKNGQTRLYLGSQHGVDYRLLGNRFLANNSGARRLIAKKHFDPPKLT